LAKLDDKSQNYVDVFKKKVNVEREKFWEQNVVQFLFLMDWQSIVDDGLFVDGV
jgi:hypothetical protein